MHVETEIFTSLEFKKLLSESENRSEGLLKFVRASERFDANKKNNHDIVKSYISSSADCAELLQCTKGQISPIDLGLAFRCINSVLSRTAGDLQEFYGKVGISLCESIVRFHLQKVYHALGLHQCPRTVISALKMLTLLVVQGRESAREMAHQLDFTLNCFKDILKRFKGKFMFEIRKSYINFVISFFLSGDVRTMSRIFDVRGFVSAIFPELCSDPASTVQIVLSTILENGVKNPAVSKSSKARFFAEGKLLKHIKNLYQWDGIFDISGCKKVEEKNYVRNLVSQFLYHVCCPFEYGINFLDKELGTGDKCKNHVLLKFLISLSSSSADIMVRDLIVKILEACPDLLLPFMKDFRLTLEPKNEEIWIRNCELAQAVYSNQPDVATGLHYMVKYKKSHSDHKTQLDTLVRMILPGIISPNFSCVTIMKHCMTSKSPQIRQNTLDLLLIFMQKLESSMPFMLDKSNWEKAGYSDEEAEICYAKFEDALFDNHLNISYLVQLWKVVSTYQENALKIVLLKILKLCQKLFPTDVQETKFDFTCLLKNVQATQQIVDASSNCDLDIMIIEMLSERPQMYKWFKGFHKGNTPFKLLLQVIQNSPNLSELHTKTSDLCQKVLILSSIFQENEASEAKLWISCIHPDIRGNNDHVTIQYFNDLCSKVARIPMQYFDLLSAEQNESVSKSDVNFWESLQDVDIDTASNFDWEKLASRQDNFTNNPENELGAVSLVCVAALDGLKEATSLMDEEKRVLDEYLVKVLSGLLNSTRNQENAKFFSQNLLRAARKVTSILEASYPNLTNFKTFLTIWTRGSLLKSKNRDGSVFTGMEGWFWDGIRSKTPKKTLLSIVAPMLEPKDDPLDLMAILPQCLLYFDTFDLSSNVASCKEIFCCIVKIIAAIQENSDTNPLWANVKNRAEMWVVQNPRIQDLFLQDIYQKQDNAVALVNIELESSENCKLHSMCTQVVAEFLTRIHTADTTSAFKLLTSKIVQSLPGFFEGLNESMTSDIKNLILPHLFTGIRGLLSIDECTDVVTNIAHKISSFKSKPVAKLAAKMLCVAVDRLSDQGSNDYCGFHAVMKLLFDFMCSGVLKKNVRLISTLSVLVRKYPSLAAYSHPGVVEYLLKRSDACRINLLAELVKNNPSLVECLVRDNFFDSLRNKEDAISAIPLSNTVLVVLVKDFDTNISHIRRIFDGYWPNFTSTDSCEYIKSILKSDESLYFLRNLFELCMKLGGEHKVLKVFELLSSDTCDLGSDEIFGLLHSCSSVFSKTDLGFPLKMSALLLFQKAAVSNSAVSDPDSVFKLVREIAASVDPSDRETLALKFNQKWSKFVKSTLKQYFNRANALRCICCFVELLDFEGGTMDVLTLKEMVVSHSKFLPVLLNEDAKLKSALLELHYELVLRMNAQDLSSSDLCYLLSAYTATLSESDQLILNTLLVYERKGVSFTDMKPFLWGENAISSYKARKNLGENLWKKPGSTEILACIDESVMEFTICHFPVKRRMVFIEKSDSDLRYFENDVAGTISAAKNHILREQVATQGVYDPCFILPTFLYVLSPENLLDCKSFIRSGALSFLMCCLASHCHAVRALAANCLILYYKHAQTAWFPENNLTMFLIRSVRNNIPTKEVSKGQKVIAKLPGVVANFLAAIVQLQFHAKDHMFSVLHRYLLVKPVLDLNDIPEFYVLFFSAEMESKIERTWVVNLIAGSLRDEGDYKTINRRNVVQLLTCLHDSAVADNFVRRQVFEVFERICAIRSAALDLVKNKGFVSWLTVAASNQPCRQNEYSRVAQTIGRAGQRRDDTKDIIRVVSTLWKSLDVADIVMVKKKDDQNAEDDTRIASTPIRVLKHLITLSVMLQSNLLNCQEFDECFCEEGLVVLESCVRELNARNDAAKKKELLDKVKDDFYLDERDVEILYSVAKRILEGSRIVESKYVGTVCVVVKLFSCWRPESRINSFELWKKIFHFVATAAVAYWSKDPVFVQQNILHLCAWIENCWLMIDCEPDAGDRRAMVLLYDVIFDQTHRLGEAYLQSIDTVNRVLLHGKKEGKAAEILRTMNEIRLTVLQQ